MSVRKIGVIGTGRVGAGLAALAVSRGIPTVVVGHSREGLLKCRDALIRHLEELVRRGWLRDPERYAALERLEITDAWEGLRGAELVFEAVREERATKQAVLRKAEEYLMDRVPVLCCTSALLPSELAAAADRPERILAVHPIQPAYLRPMVELAGHAASPPGFPETVAETLRRDLGQQVIVLRKESRGFLLNRITQAMLRESLELLDQGVAAPADLEQIVRCGLCLRCDAAGLLEVFEDVGMGLQARLTGFFEPEGPGSSFCSAAAMRPEAPGAELRSDGPPPAPFPDCAARQERFYNGLRPGGFPEGSGAGRLWGE